MRGKQIMNTKQVNTRRITPADAGKTSRHLVGINQSQDHPRGCGENDVRLRKFDPVPGSPPRMRGKLFGKTSERERRRITPADAGKTANLHSQVTFEKDHPRGCGENLLIRHPYLYSLGSPPRMRGKRYEPATEEEDDGITPAEAGKTRSCPIAACCPWDHPRGCGENREALQFNCVGLGSPPRMRGKLITLRPYQQECRITPADAGKTRSRCRQKYRG